LKRRSKVIIGVVSGKGGVGKTTTTANLTAAFGAHFGKRVLAVDCNHEASDLPMWFSLYPPMPSREKKLQGGLTVYSYRPGIDVMPVSSVEGVSTDKLKRALRRSGYHYVLLDAPPINSGRVFELSDSLIVVTNPDVVAVADALRTIKRAEEQKLEVLGIEVNRIRKKKYELSHAELTSLFRTPIVSTIPDDKKVLMSLAEGTPTILRYPNSKAALEFKKLAAMLLGEEFKVGVLERFIPFGRR
jgi:septum site-determining protein MinD